MIGGEWNVNSLTQFCDEVIVVTILSIPLLPSCLHDKIFWWYSKSGEYTVKSGYWLDLMGNQEIDDSPISDDVCSFWRCV